MRYGGSVSHIFVDVVLKNVCDTITVGHFSGSDCTLVSGSDCTLVCIFQDCTVVRIFPDVVN